MNVNRNLLILAGVFLIGTITFYSISDRAGVDPLNQNQTQIYFEDHSFDVEIADTPEERAEGLMFKEELGENEGMLFVYEDEDYRSFWMKNTTIRLDIIFLDSDLEVINIEAANPEPNTSDENLASYTSERPAQYVLEINQNRSEEIGLEEGSKMGLGLEFRG